MINIDKLILDARKMNNKDELKAFQDLKSEMMLFKTAKNAKPYTETAELDLIQKMIKSYLKSVETYREASREDLATEMEKEISILQTLLPAAPSQQEIENYLSLWMKRTSVCNLNGEYAIPKKVMGAAIKSVKDEFPTADGKMISDIVKTHTV